MSKKWKTVLKTENRKNRGFTIIELLTAIAIMGVLSVTIIYMMTSSSKTYSRLSIESQLQSEAQLVANSITEIAIDSFDAKDELPADYISGGDNFKGKSLLLETTAESVKKQYLVVPVEAEKALYLVQRHYDASNDTWSSDATADRALLANYITDFKVDTSRVEKENMLEFSLSYEKNGRSYTGQYQVLMRNRAYADKEADSPEAPKAERLLIDVTPKLVYVDVKKNAVDGYHIESVGPTSLNYGNGIQFKATVTSNFGASKDVEWDLKNEDGAIFSMSSAKAETSNLVYKTSEKDFVDSAVDMFTLAITKSDETPEGKIVSASPKMAQILLRRVKGLNLYALSGTTQWNDRFTELYKGTKSDEAQGYAYKGTGGSYLPVQLNASISSVNIDYGGGLTWKLEVKNDSGIFVPCTNSSLASMPGMNEYAEVETLTSNTMTVNLGSAAKNGDLFRVTATSIFDDSFSKSYIFGVAPSGDADDDGFYSRGYYTNMSSFYKGKTIHDSDPAVGEVVYLSVSYISGSMKSVPTEKLDEYVKLKYVDGGYRLYIDFDAFAYNDNQKNTFYEGNVKIHFDIGYAVHDGSKTQYYINGHTAGDKKADMVAKVKQNLGIDISEDDIIQGHGLDLVYQLEPVVVSKISPTEEIIVLKKGESKNIYVKTSYYNLLSPRNGMYYFGAYINDMKDNLVQPGKTDVNSYFSLQMTSDYGDTNRYIDTASIQLTAKALSAQKKYLTSPATVRLAANDYYLISQATPSYTDYKVMIANVEGTDVYIQGPAEDVGNVMAWTAEQRAKIEAGTETEVTGLNTSGTIVTSTVYKKSNKYYCEYGGKTYRYNATYKFWQK